MATINDIGVPGQPMNNPPLTPWQAAVRDRLTVTSAAVTPGAGWTSSGTVTKQGRLVALNFGLNKASWAANEVVATVPAGYRPASGAVYFAGVSLAGTIPMYANADGTIKAVNAGTHAFISGSAAWATA